MEGLAAHVNVCLHTASGIKPLSQVSSTTKEHYVRTPLLIAAAGSMLAAGLLAVPAVAEPTMNPGGPCLQENQTVSRSSVPTYLDVEQQLRSIEHNSKGRVAVASAGESGEGRELYYATVGTGDTVIWLQARIHGNELHSTEAVLQILQHLGSSNSPEVKQILSELTIVAIPMYNPDGAEANIRQSTTPFRQDLNRDWEQFRQPESEAFWHLFVEYAPSIALDLHHMGQAPRVAGTNDLNQFQIGAHSVDPSRMAPEQWTLARQISEVSIDAISGYGQTHVAKYPYIDITTGVISRMILGGTAPAGFDPESQTNVDAAIFYEVRSVGQKSNGYLENLFTKPTMAVLNAAADGSLYTSDWQDYDNLSYATSGPCGY